jgi:LuxR family transcriptional regulator, regulator of acetate metabolism
MTVGKSSVGKPSRAAAGSMTGLRAALRRLRLSHSLAQIIEKAPLEACRGCGFERAVLFSVHDSEIIVESAHFEGDPRWADEFLLFGRSNPQELEQHRSIEAEIIRQRGPVLVTDAQNDPRTIKPLVSALRTKSYVAAPIMPEGPVIGILEADCYFSGRQLTGLDLDALWTFAERLGYAVERVALLERLRSQQRSIRELLGITIEALSEADESDVELGSSRQRAAGRSGPLHGLPSSADSAIEDLLTPRELQVLALMASGKTNADVASRLMISESTVKSHVKNILRKLEAGNRAEAASRYMLASLRTRVTRSRSLVVGGEDVPTSVEF